MAVDERRLGGVTRETPFESRLRTARVTIRFTPEELAEVQEAAQRLHSRSYTHVNVGRYIRNRALGAARDANREARALQEKSDNALERNVSQSSAPARKKVRQRSRSDKSVDGGRR